jgi:hypothetical protein
MLVSTPTHRRVRRWRMRAAAGLALCTSALLCLPATASAAPSRAGVSAVHDGGTAAVPRGYGITEAQALAEAHKSGAKVQVTSATTPSSTLTADPDGRLTLTTASEPVRKRVDGTWKPLNATLEKNADGSISPAITTSELRLSGGGTGPLAVMTDDGTSLSLTAPFTLQAPVLSGDTATYSGVLPGVSLVITASSQGGFSEVLVIANARAAQNPRLKHLTFATKTTGGISLRADAAGNIIAGRGHQVLFSAPAPHIWDSAATENTPAVTDTATGQRMDVRTGQPVNSTVSGPGEDARTGTIGVRLDKGTLTLSPDGALLGATKASYPEYIDPTYAAGSEEQEWNTVNQTYPTTSNWRTSGYLQVGYDNWDADSVGVARSFVQESVPTSLDTATIFSSTVYFTEEVSPSCTAEGIELWRTGGINSTNTWDNQPAWDNELDEESFAHGDGSGCPAASVGFDITSEMKTAASGAWSNITLGLQAEDESNDLGWKQFSNVVTMSTTYDHAPETPTVLTTSPATTCGASTPGTVGKGDVMLYASVHDPDGGALDVTFNATQTSNGDTIADTVVDATAGTTAALELTEAELDSAAGATATSATSGNQIEVSWNVTLSDGTLSSGTSTTCHFYYNPLAPGAPDVSQTASSYTIGQAETFDITPDVSDTTPSEYYWQLNGGDAQVATAVDGDASFKVTPTQYTNDLTVTAISSGGNVGGDSAQVIFNAAEPTAETDGDFTGDGVPDLVTVGGTGTSLPAGLWLYRGQADAGGAGDGQVITSGTDLGTEGNGIAGDYEPSDFDGGQVITGQFNDNNLNDAAVYYPTGPYAGQAVIIDGNGNGNVLDDESEATAGDTGDIQSIGPDVLADADQNVGVGDTPLQIADGYNADPGDPVGYPDLFAINGDDSSTGYDGYYLEYFQNDGTPGSYINAIMPGSTTSSNGLLDTPDGTMDWNDWTMATMQDSSGDVDMFLYNSSTDALYLWQDFTINDSTSDASYTQYELSSDWDPGTLASLQAAPITGSSTLGLWAVTTSGTVSAWTADPATPAITENAAQTLLGPIHDWRLGDSDDSNSAVTSAGDTGSGTALDLAGNNTSGCSTTAADDCGTSWDTGDLFNPAIDFNSSYDGYLDTSGQAVGATSSYTVSAWVKPAALGGYILSEYGTEFSCLRLSIEKVTTGAVTTGYWQFATTSSDTSGSTATEATVSDTYTVKLGVWAHLTITYDASTGRFTLYVDGIDAATATTSTVWSSGCNTFALGAGVSSSDLGGYFDGEMADVETWGTALTPTAVADISGTPGYMLFPSDGDQYPSGSSWSTAGSAVTFSDGVLTVKETGTGTTTETYGTSGYDDAVLVLQTDGNLVIYPTAADAKATTGSLWASGTQGNTADCMFLQPDGNLVIYSDDGEALWSSGTSN